MGPAESTHMTNAEPAEGATATDVPSQDAIKKTKKKKDKVRSAWISFMGRIVAQIVGAAATIVLTLVFVQKYSDSKARVAPQPATVRIEFVVEMPGARAGNQADVAAAVAREIVAATQHAAAVNGSVKLVPSVSRVSTQ
jgi:hypothetical protein